MALQIILGAFLLLWFFEPGQANTARTWKPVNELSKAEQAEIDPRTS